MYKVCLDPGHGINTPGKRSPDGSFFEWEFNKDIVDRATKILSKYNSIKVINSKGNAINDTPLSERCRRANTEGCELFISIHANAASSAGWNEGASGWEAWVYSNKDATGRLALCVNKAYSTMFPDVRNRGIKVNSGYYVLNKTSMPSIIIEHGFYTCHKDMEMMKTAEYRNKAAQACVNAIARCLNISAPVPYNKPSTSINDNTTVPKSNCPEWKSNGERYLYNMGIITSHHDPLEKIDIGTLGIMVKNYLEKEKK